MSTSSKLMDKNQETSTQEQRGHTVTLLNKYYWKAPGILSSLNNTITNTNTQMVWSPCCKIHEYPHRIPSYLTGLQGREGGGGGGGIFQHVGRVTSCSTPIGFWRLHSSQQARTLCLPHLTGLQGNLICMLLEKMIPG